MTIFEAVMFGILQGIAEFLPISSSGHLALAHNLFGRGYHGFGFDIALHFATLISVCFVYKKDILALVKGFFGIMKKLFTGNFRKIGEGDEKIFICVFVSALPLVPIKIFGIDEIAESFGGINLFVGTALIFNAFMLFCCDRIKIGKKRMDESYLPAIGTGAIQATFGILPGISRSGSTITALRFFGIEKTECVRFSFLMSLPAVIGASVFKLPKLFSSPGEGIGVIPIIIGMATAAAVGFFAIKLLQYISTKNYKIFAFYCLLAGSIAIMADIL